jgi:hypothetical protein
MSIPVNPSVKQYRTSYSLPHISAHARNLMPNEIPNEKPHSPSQTRNNHKRIAEQLYKASSKGHSFINDHHCITKRCSNPGCGAFLRTAGQHICVYVHQSQHSRGGRRTRRIRR